MLGGVPTHPSRSKGGSGARLDTKEEANLLATLDQHTLDKWALG